MNHPGYFTNAHLLFNNSAGMRRRIPSVSAPPFGLVLQILARPFFSLGKDQ